MHNWADAWLNEGFATYAEWLWAGYTQFARPNQIFRGTYDYFATVIRATKRLARAEEQ